jgi:hypothetical protein
MTREPTSLQVSVPKIRFCNIGGGDRQEPIVMYDAQVLDSAMQWGILVQRAMNARLIIIGDKPLKEPAQMCLPKYDHVVETFPVGSCRSASPHGHRMSIGLTSDTALGAAQDPNS